MAELPIQRSRAMVLPRARGRPRVYPFDRMQIGDSFGVEGRSRARSVSASISKWHRVNPGAAKFELRREIGQPNKWRCWRVK